MTSHQAEPVLSSAHDTAVPVRDQFTRTFLRRVGPELSETFSEAQLAGVRRAFASRQIGAHPVDIRHTFDIFSFSFYVVLLCGREGRSQERRRLERSPVNQLVRIAIGSGILVLFLLTLARMLGDVGAVPGR